MNKSGLLHRAAEVKAPEPIQNKAKDSAEIAVHMAEYEAKHGKVVTTPILSRAPENFAYRNLRDKNKIIAGRDSE